MPRSKGEALGNYGLSAISGTLLAMSYAMHPIWWAAWLAPAPVIVATLRAPVAHRRWLPLLAGLIGGASSFFYHLIVGGWFAALLIHMSPHGSAGSIAYSQMNALPIIQVASLGGVPAITFVVLLGGSLLGIMMATKMNMDRRDAPMIFAAAVMVIGAPLFGPGI